MPITSVKYTMPDVLEAIINGQTRSVPDTMLNADRRLIAEWEAQGNTIAPYVVFISPEEVNTEASRRITTGVAFGGNIYQMDATSKTRISGAATLAGFAMASGAQAGDYLWHGGTSPFEWITADNSIVQLDAPTMFAIGQAAANWEAAHVFAARALKDMDPIPLDYSDDVYWPGA